MATYWVINGKQMSNEEYMEMIRRQEAEREQAKRQAEALMKRLTESYTELSEFMQHNPGIVQRVDCDQEHMQQAIYQKLRQNLQAANEAPRCHWIKDDGIVCGSPRMRKSDYCYAHMQMSKARPKKMRGWPGVSDGNAVQMAITEVQRALIDDEISEKKAGLLLYSLQIASGNLERTTFGERPGEMVTECVDAEETPTTETRRHGEERESGDYHGFSRINADQKAFTAENAEGAEENKSSSRMNEDDAEVRANLDGVALMHAKLGSIGIVSLKCTPNWDEYGRGRQEKRD